MRGYPSGRQRISPCSRLPNPLKCVQGLGDQRLRGLSQNRARQALRLAQVNIWQSQPEGTHDLSVLIGSHASQHKKGGGPEMAPAMT